jgi:hypothetical protein
MGKIGRGSQMVAWHQDWLANWLTDWPTNWLTLTLALTSHELYDIEGQIWSCVCLQALSSDPFNEQEGNLTCGCSTKRCRKQFLRHVRTTATFILHDTQEESTVEFSKTFNFQEICKGYSGIYCRDVCWKTIDVSDKYFVLIFRVEEESQDKNNMKK